MKKFYAIILVGLLAALCALAQYPNSSEANVTGQLTLVRTVNLLQQAQLTRIQSFGAVAAEMPPPIPVKGKIPQLLTIQSAVSIPPTQALTVSSTFSGTAFNGLTHADQRNANNGNQFSVEPPSPGIAVANGFVLEGVNNAVQVFTTSGTPLLPQAVSSNQLFGLPPAIIRDTNTNGPFPTDMRVFYDQTINRWFVIQRAADRDTAGNPLFSSHLYMAVSQASDPTGIYNIYSMETTNLGNLHCPCYPDYPQIGADQYGLYISSNEFSIINNQFVDVTILAISKSALGSGATIPTAYRFILRNFSGYEATVFPATTPPGASYFVASNGVEYFLSSLPQQGNHLAVWSMSNTSSLDTPAPKPVLSQTIIDSLGYVAPDPAKQRPGPLPYGSTLTPPGSLAFIDGADNRILSLVYSGGRLYATLGTEVMDSGGNVTDGAAYMIVSPTFRKDPRDPNPNKTEVLSAFVLRQGYLLVQNNHLLRPAIAVNPQGRGAIAVTLVGPDYYPSAAFVPIDTFTTGTTVQLAGPGVAPEDGFTGYPGGFFPGTARWGDYSAAFAAADGSIWMTAQFIPNAPRTQFANWGTYLMRYF
jgi:hypothetical protein